MDLHRLLERPDPGGRRLAAIVDGSQDAIVITDAQGSITSWSPAAERLFGWTATDMLGGSGRQLVPADRAGETRRLRRAALAETAIERFETRRVRRDGSTVAVELTFHWTRDEDGAIIGSSAIYRDISERRLAEVLLAAQTKRLQELSTAERNTGPSSARQPTSGPRQGPVTRTLALARDLLGLEVAALVQHVGGDLVLRAVDGDRSLIELPEGGRAPLGAAPRPGADGRSGTIVVETVRGGAGATVPLPLADGARAFVGVPVRLSDGRSYGTMCAAGRRLARRPGRRDLQMLDGLASLIAGELEGEQVESDARRAASELSGISALLAALDARDHYTGEHSLAVVQLARAVGLRLGLGEPEVAAVEQVALLHDLGKVGIPDTILLKPGSLTELEWDLMREHPAIGARIIASIASLAHLAPAVHAEHERWDGTGYGEGLRGEEIPTASRITLACDAYHAMTSDRPYRSAISAAAARAQLRACGGTQFDPRVVDALLGVLEDPVGTQA